MSVIIQGNMVVSVTIREAPYLKGKSVIYFGTCRRGDDYEFVASASCGLPRFEGMTDEEAAKSFYLEYMKPIFNSSHSAPNPTSNKVKDKYLAKELATTHILAHRELAPFKGKMKQTKAERNLARMMGLSSVVMFLSELDSLPISTIRRRLVQL